MLVKVDAVLVYTMVHVCVVPGCSNRSDRETHLSYHCLPLKNRKLLKIWEHKIGRKNLPKTVHSRVCSEHFIKSKGRILMRDEVPTLKLPKLATAVLPPSKRKSPRKRPHRLEGASGSPTCKQSGESDAHATVDSDMNTDLTGEEIMAENKSLRQTVCTLKQQLTVLEQNLEMSRFRLASIASDDQKVTFYTGFPSYKALMACFKFLGPGVHSLVYWGNTNTELHGKKMGRNQSLPPLEEFFLVLVRLRLGLFEKDLADRFGISTSSVSRICITWINFLYLKLHEIPLWSARDKVKSSMPKSFRDLYPTTRAIIDATEIFVEKPSVPEIQQRTFSSYKNHNTYKGLVGISPGGAITFVSRLFPGSISDRELTRQSGFLKLLDPGDSIMADRGFDIQDDLTPLGVRLNIPPFLRGKSQLEENELIETRRIASLRIHVERAMERIKNYHIFDRTLPASLNNIAEQMFFVCAVLTNFWPPLCT